MYHSSCSIQMNFLNVIIVGIAPVHSTGTMVQCQTVGPQHVGSDKNTSIGSIHPGLFNPPYAVIDFILFPVCPVHPAVVQRDGRRQKSGYYYNIETWVITFNLAVSCHAGVRQHHQLSLWRLITSYILSLTGIFAFHLSLTCW